MILCYVFLLFTICFKSQYKNMNKELILSTLRIVYASELLKELTRLQLTLNLIKIDFDQLWHN